MPKLLNHPNLNLSAYSQVTERDNFEMDFALAKSMLSSIKSANLMKQQLWHSHKRTMQSSYRVFLGGSCYRPGLWEAIKKITSNEFCWWEMGEVGPLPVVSVFAPSWIRFHHTLLHHSLSGQI